MNDSFFINNNNPLRTIIYLIKQYLDNEKKKKTFKIVNNVPIVDEV